MRRHAPGVAAIIFAIVVLFAGCGSGVSSTEQSQQQSISNAEESLRSRGFTKVTLRIRLADGTVEEHCVWLSDSVTERERGLMQLSDPSLGGGDAMVFVFEEETSAVFTMADTPQPLSIAWVDSAGAVIGTTDMDPCPPGTKSCPRYPAPRPLKMAIEMAQGRLQDWGIGPGALVSLGDAC
jgi:uncharacterized membrane protein (UPF0127 family)